MKPLNSPGPAGWLISSMVALSFCAWCSGGVADGFPQRFPPSGAADVNPDTHLVLTFPKPPKLGTSGKIVVVDVEDARPVDTLDMSIPAGPHVSLSVSKAEAEKRTAAGQPEPTYQVTTIGGQEGFHFHPIIVRGNVATIYLHNNILKYGRKYRVNIDPGVLGAAGEDFSGFNADDAWTFTTKRAAPAADATLLRVAADGSGDFNTVQGAIDFVPDHPPERVTVLIMSGNYEELVFFRNKSNLTIRGEDRNKVVVGYGNNSSFNPSRDGTSLRPAFSVLDSTDIQLSQFTINNYYIGQAEALKVSGSRNIIDNMTLNGSGDALNLRGSVYVVDTLLTGDGDTILGWGPAFFERCEIHSIGPFNWIRNPRTNHGNVFKDCTFIGVDEPLPWTRTPDGGGRRVKAVVARLPNNHGLNYPFAEAVLINARMQGIAPEGWGPVEDPSTFDWTNVHFWEYNTRDLDGRPIDMSMRHPIVRELTLPGDAETIANYSSPEYVLEGWKPVVHQQRQSTRHREYPETRQND